MASPDTSYSLCPVTPFPLFGLTPGETYHPTSDPGLMDVGGNPENGRARPSTLSQCPGLLLSDPSGVTHVSVCEGEKHFGVGKLPRRGEETV